MRNGIALTVLALVAAVAAVVAVATSGAVTPPNDGYDHTGHK